MKRFRRIFISSLMVLSMISLISTSVLADENMGLPKDFIGKSPYEVDRILHGNYIEDRIVVYDEETGYYNPLYFNLGNISPNAIEPVDPGEGGFWRTYFSKIEWVKRSGVWSLSLTPKGNVVEKNRTWNSIKNTFSHDTQWANSGNSTVDSSMANQFYCHYDFAWTGEAGPTWDLEPSTPDRGYLGFVLNKCN